MAQALPTLDTICHDGPIEKWNHRRFDLAQDGQDATDTTSSRHKMG